MGRCPPLLVAVAVAMWAAAAAADEHTCSRTVAFTETVFHVEYQPVVRSQYAKCWGRRCSKTRVFWQTVKTSEVVQSYRKEVECCPGYSRRTPSHACLPVCEGGCPERQECSAPGRCTCRDGFLPGLDQHTCLSPCELRGCQHGHCTDLHTCTCDPGYSSHEGGECEPVCAAGCGQNARCEAPGRCRCLDGYGGLGSAGCHPLCSLQTRGAECVDTERYRCLPGYVFDKQTATEYTCRPTCREECRNGECVAPDTCGCLEGYELAGHACRPVCEHACGRGDCVAPGTCRCHRGYRPDPQDDTNSTCVPACRQDCVNGRCTAPDTCSCFDGFAGPVPANGSLETTSSSSTGPAAGEEAFANMCLPVCAPACRNATCVLPNTCQCLDGYEPDPADAANATCRPACQPACVNADCVAPGICCCMEGFHPDPSDPSNSTCQLVSQALELCTREGCRTAGGSARPAAAAAAGGAVAVAVAALAAAALCWLRGRRRHTAVAGPGNPALADDEQRQFDQQLLEESNVDSDD